MNYWDTHGFLFLFGCVFFPRITTLFFTSVSFGVLHILGWIFAPHLLVAFLASFTYWDTNPVLVAISWIVAFAGTGGEAKVVSKSVN